MPGIGEPPLQPCRTVPGLLAWRHARNPTDIAIVLVVFVIFFLWFFPKVIRAFRRIFRSAAAFFRGESFAGPR